MISLAKLGAFSKMVHGGSTARLSTNLGVQHLEVRIERLKDQCLGAAGATCDQQYSTITKSIQESLNIIKNIT